MSIAQQLYEGVDITGEGTVGLITYMRTDSLRLSEEAIAAAKGFIESRYGKEYYPGKARTLQDQGQCPGRPRGHPALRRDPHPGGREEGPDRRAVPALQADLEPLPGLPDGQRAVYDSVSIEAAVRRLHLPGQPLGSLKFSGYTAVYEEGRDEEEEAPQSPLPDLKEGEPLELGRA